MIPKMSHGLVKQKEIAAEDLECYAGTCGSFFHLLFH